MGEDKMEKTKWASEALATIVNFIDAQCGGVGTVVDSRG